MHNVSVGYAAHILSFPLDETQWTANQKSEFATFQLQPEELEILRRIDLPQRLRLDYERDEPFIGSVMHDLGKVAMVQAYPGLYPMLVEELRQRNWSISMSTVEDRIADGLNHPVVSEILGAKWGIGDRLCHAIEKHHRPEIDETFAFLIGVSNIVGHLLYPFPAEAEYPIAAALQAGVRHRLEAFFPENLFDQPLLDLDEFNQLTQAVSPAVQRLTVEMRNSVN